MDCWVDPTDFSAVLNVIDEPEMILKGDQDELLAIKRRSSRSKSWFVVVYKEVNQKDGFIVTSYLTTDLRWLLKRGVIWSKQS